jgi:hypothetical protein
MKLRISDVSKEESYIATAIHSIVQRTGEISLLTKIIVEITFEKHFYDV